ncbi:hypothetical protein DUNSADRAFT_7188 [Dunaliella salina]|uniref:Uncharacterized protein n=1 Tax=Dunaliella salina TaxID=3046 RepID=A0ABQ7GLU7_DUNSA|nr:hypothetical protein DUNSADRAFT_7188 [Dunaliella salina]|eukprot:KAF5835586.1 hypothetical protein DUNSADRAFT_7188 [Dunaliella salina]
MGLFQAIAKYAAQQPHAVLSLATEAGARALDAHILPNVQVCDHVLAPVVPIAPQPQSFGPLETKAEEEAMAAGVASPYVADVGWSIKALRQAGITALLNNATAFMPSDTAILHHATEHSVSSADPRLVPTDEALKRYSASNPMAASAATLGSPSDVVLTLESFPEGVSVYSSLTGDRITVTRSGPLLSVSTGSLPGEIIGGKSLPPSSIPEGTSVHTSALGTPLVITKLAGALAVAATFEGVTRTAKVVKTTITSGQLVLHIVDKVLAPLL